MLQIIPRRTRTSRRPFDEETALRPSDIEYARDIFADLVIAIALKRSKSLHTSEIEALAEQSLNMAKRFAAAQQQSIQTGKVAIAQVESLDKPLPFGSSATFANFLSFPANTRKCLSMYDFEAVCRGCLMKIGSRRI